MQNEITDVTVTETFPLATRHPDKTYPECVINRLLCVGRYYASFLPGAKRSITRERRRYEKTWPGVNAAVFRMLDKI